MKRELKVFIFIFFIILIATILIISTNAPNKITGNVVISAGCTTNNQCPFNKICQNNLCVSQLGAICTTHNQCNTKFCENNVCVNPRPVGARCIINNECVSSCTNGFCAKIQNGRGPCTYASDCVSSFCQRNQCVEAGTRQNGKDLYVITRSPNGNNFLVYDRDSLQQPNTLIPRCNINLADLAFLGTTQNIGVNPSKIVVNPAGTEVFILSDWSTQASLSNRFIIPIDPRNCKLSRPVITLQPYIGRVADMVIDLTGNYLYGLTGDGSIFRFNLEKEERPLKFDIVEIQGRGFVIKTRAIMQDLARNPSHLIAQRQQKKIAIPSTILNDALYPDQYIYTIDEVGNIFKLDSTLLNLIMPTNDFNLPTDDSRLESVILDRAKFDHTVEMKVSPNNILYVTDPLSHKICPISPSYNYQGRHLSRCPNNQADCSGSACKVTINSPEFATTLNDLSGLFAFFSDIDALLYYDSLSSSSRSRTVDGTIHQISDINSVGSYLFMSEINPNYKIHIINSATTTENSHPTISLNSPPILLGSWQGSRVFGPNCDDSDGRDYVVKSSAVGTTEGCINSGTLKEVYCNNQGIKVEENKDCSTVAGKLSCALNLGICSSAPLCSDPDGRNYFLKSSNSRGRTVNTPNGITSGNEVCIDNNNLREYYCNSNRELTSEQKDCRTVSGMVGCRNGVCVSCIDSDSGQDYNVRGTVTSSTVTSSGETKSDVCVSMTQLKEYYCDTTNHVQSEIKDCTTISGKNTCGAGTCSSATINVCNNGNDGGVNPFKGTKAFQTSTAGQRFDYSEHCENENLIEYSCSGTRLNTDTINCAGQYGVGSYCLQDISSSGVGPYAYCLNPDCNSVTVDIHGKISGDYDYVNLPLEFPGRAINIFKPKTGITIPTSIQQLERYRCVSGIQGGPSYTCDYYRNGGEIAWSSVNFPSYCTRIGLNGLHLRENEYPLSLTISEDLVA